MTIDSRDEPEDQWGDGRDVPAQEVGYKKPPVHGQVKPGELRNPYGRKGKRGRQQDSGGGLALEIMRELDMVIPVKVNGKTKKLPVSQIVARRFRDDLIGSPKDRHQAMTTLHKLKLIDGFTDFQNWRENQDRQYDVDLDEAFAAAELFQTGYGDSEDRAYRAAVASCSCASMAPYQIADNIEDPVGAPCDPASPQPSAHDELLAPSDCTGGGPETRAGNEETRWSGDDFYDGMIDG